MSLENAYAQAQYDFNASFGDELSFKADDVLKILYQIDNEWVYAKSLMKPLNTYSLNYAPAGNVPLNHIKIIRLPDSLFDTSNEPNKLYLALSDFHLVEIGDLEFTTGQLIISLKILDENWHYGCYLNDYDKTGIFPLSHVTPIYLSSIIESNSKNIQSRDNLSDNKQQQKTDTGDAIYFRQAQAIKSFNPEDYNYNQKSSNQNHTFLFLSIGDFVLVKAKFDENWFEGENFKGDKGLFPSKCIKFLNEQRIDDSKPNNSLRRSEESTGEIRLNRTQRNYLNLENSDEKNSIALPTSDEASIKSSNESNAAKILTRFNGRSEEPSVQSARSFGQALYEFHPSNLNELGCLKDEYLEIVTMYMTNDWIKVRNMYGKEGLVPASYLNLLSDSESQKAQNVFEIQKLKKVDNVIFDLVKEAKQKAEFDHSRFDNFQHQSVVAKNQIATHQFQQQQLLQQPLSTSSSRPKPPIPPKPKLNKEITADGELITKSMEQTRPVFYDSKILANIKNLESIIKNQQEFSTVNRSNCLKNSTLILNNCDQDHGVDENQTNNASTTIASIKAETKLDTMKKNLSEMKNLFVESAKNHELALKQIEEPEIKRQISFAHISDHQNHHQDVNELIIDKKINNIKQRRHCIRELIETEIDMYNELNVCYSLFMSISSFSIPINFDRDAIFEDVRHVINFSGSLIQLFNKELNGTKPSEITEMNSMDDYRIGLCLARYAEEMRKVYAKYVKNHPNISEFLKKYQQDQQIAEFITRTLEKEKQSFKVASLPVILIKPVQRIFKYPLFISRLIEDTDKSHLDYDDLVQAAEIFKTMLEFINEYKRRIEIVNKYLTIQKNETFSDMVKRINMKTIKKKSTRFSIQVSNIIGLFNQKVVDQEFESEHNKFKTTEKNIRSIYHYIETKLNNTRQLLDSELSLYNRMLYIMHDETSSFSILHDSAYQRRHTIFNFYQTNIRDYVLIPLNELLNLYMGPNKLIAKRNDKLLDYEAALGELESNNRTAANNLDRSFTNQTVENKVEASKKLYEALNEQLIEELPTLIEYSLKLVTSSIGRYNCLTSDFISEIHQNFKHSVNKSNVEAIDLNSALNVQESIARLDELNAEVIKYFKENFIDNKDKSMFISYVLPSIQQQNEAQKNLLRKKYETDKLYVVTEKFIGDQNLRQLNQNQDDYVGVIKFYDPVGQTHIWLVDNGSEIGFLPSAILKKYEQPPIVVEADEQDESTSKNLIEFDDKTNLSRTISLPNTKSKCLALYNFKSSSSNTINLKKGEHYYVIEKCDKIGDPDWWLLETITKPIILGYAPSNYLMLL